MSKNIFILFLFLCSLNSFSQKYDLNHKAHKSDTLVVFKEIKKEKTKIIDEIEIDLLLDNNLCEILSIRNSNLLDEEMLKKLRANV